MRQNLTTATEDNQNIKLKAGICPAEYRGLHFQSTYLVCYCNTNLVHNRLMSFYAFRLKDAQVFKQLCVVFHVSNSHIDVKAFAAGVIR
jgi:hypothetical protein